MTLAGWIFLTISLVSVWSLAGYCYWRVIKGGARIEPPPDSLGG